MNALTHGMALALERQLDAWARRHLRSASSPSAAPASGPSPPAATSARSTTPGARWTATAGATSRFFADEYRLNTKIKRYPKPYVGLMDGVVMGGGVGVSVHGTRRVAGDRTVFAMPETGIGLFPDVGATYFLPRLPGQTGMWLGLTGARLKTADAVACGICDFHVPTPRHGRAARRPRTLRRRPGASRSRRSTGSSRPSPACREDETVLDRHRARIDRCFGADSVEGVLAALQADGHDWSLAQRDAILTKSPTSTRIAFRQIREGARLEFEDCMRLEYRLARYCMTHPDFYEGVRAVIVDKDNRPRWQPATLDEATDAFVAEAFAPLGAEELAL